MRHPTPRLLKSLFTVTLITTLAGCCGCLPPPGRGGPGSAGPGRAEPGGRWRDAPPPHWQDGRERPSPEGQSRPRPRRGDAQDGQDHQP